jgi:polyisoprenoid-binding protein YceI
MRRIALALAVSALAASTVAAAANYTIDPNHTYPHFAVNHLGFSTLHGRFNTSSGKLSMDMGAKKGALELTIDTASIDTAQGKRDEHLRGPDFFNAKEFPSMTFKSTAVNFSGDKVTSVSGDLTLMGTTKPVTLQVQRMACGLNPFSKKETCGFDASGAIKRSEFGMKYGIPNLGDDIVLYISLEAVKD